MTNSEIVAAVNDERRRAKGRWWWTFSTGDGSVRIKGYKTWAQLVAVGGSKDSTGMDLSVGDFSNQLLTILNYRRPNHVG